MATKTQRLMNAVDNFALSTAPTSTYPLLAHLKVGSTARAYVYLGNPVPRGATVVSAQLLLYTSGAWGSSRTVTVHRPTAPFVAGMSRVTWNTMPAASGALDTVTKTSNVDGDLWAFDVTTEVQDAANGIIPWYGFELRTTGADKLFRSAQAASKKPALLVTWVTPPSTPNDVSPNGQRVSETHPTLTLNYADPEGTSVLTAAEVEVANVSTMIGAWNSGEVAQTGDTAVVDLASTSYPGIAAVADTVVWWRGRIKDASGLWSGWSTPVSMTYNGKPAVSISSPTEGGTVPDYTPPIVWTVSAQNRFRVTVTDSSTGAVVHDSKLRPGAQDSYGLPVSLKPGVDYVASVRTWDIVDRAEEDFTEDTVTFRVSTAGSAVAGVTDLALASIASPPGQQLSWRRSSAPDSFTILRDGIAIATGLTPGDLNTDGPELLPNGLFESNVAGWTAYLGGTLTHDVTTSYEGAGSLKFVTSGAGQGVYHDPIAAAAGDTVRVKARIRGTGTVNLQAYSVPAYAPIGDDVEIDPSSDWQEVVLTATQTVGNTSVYVLVTQVDGGAQSFNLDLVSVRDATRYAYLDDEARPNHTHEWAVAAVVNGVASNAAAVGQSIEGQMRLGGAWLIDEERGLYLFVAKTGTSTFAQGEDGATFTPLGSSKSVRITQGVRGYEGTVSGVLVGERGKTVQEWADVAHQMRARPGRLYTLLIGNEALKVVIGNMTVRPTGDSVPGLRPVSFDFWQHSAPRYPTVL